MKSEQEPQYGAEENVLQFPSPTPGTGTVIENHKSDLIEALLAELLKPLRGSDERIAIRTLGNVADEEVEDALRRPELGARLRACIEAYGIERLPKAIKQFYEALENKQGWAYKILLEAIGFPQIVASPLPINHETKDVLISNAFEQELFQNIRDIYTARKQSVASEEPEKQS